MPALAAIHLAQLACGGFFLVGLMTGVWKYRGMITSAEGQAPAYVDICHRAALMYAFAWSPGVNLVAVALPVVFFAAAVASYAVHGVLQDTDNQLRRPHRLGKRHVHGRAVGVFIYALAAGEIGGFAILFAGFVRTFLA